MSKHKDENCRVPFCKECLGKIHGVLSTARELNNPPKEKETTPEASKPKHTKTTDKILEIIDSPTEDRNRYAVALRLTEWVESLINKQRQEARLYEACEIRNSLPSKFSDALHFIDDRITELEELDSKEEGAK